MTAELQKDVQYGTLTVTADVGRAHGCISTARNTAVAPMQVNLPYGSYKRDAGKKERLSEL